MLNTLLTDLDLGKVLQYNGKKVELFDVFETQGNCEPKLKLEPENIVWADDDYPIVIYVVPLDSMSFF